MSADIEATESPALKELQPAVREMVMDPVRQGAVIASLFKAIDVLGNHDASRCPHAFAFILIQVIPDMSGPVSFILGATVLSDSKGIYLLAAICRADRDSAECCVERFKQLSAEFLARRDSKRRIGGDVGLSIVGGYLAVQKIAHEEIFREPDPPKSVQGTVAADFFWNSLHSSFPLFNLR